MILVPLLLAQGHQGMPMELINIIGLTARSLSRGMQRDARRIPVLQVGDAFKEVSQDVTKAASLPLHPGKVYEAEAHSHFSSDWVLDSH